MSLTNSIEKVRKWKGKNAKFSMRPGGAKKKKNKVSVLSVQIFEADFELKQSMTVWRIMNLFM